MSAASLGSITAVRVEALVVAFTDDVLIVRPASGRIGWDLVHAESGLVVCETATQAQALGFAQDLWLQLSQEGRDVLRRNVPGLIARLPNRDHKLLRAIAAEAAHARRNHFQPSRKPR